MLKQLNAMPASLKILMLNTFFVAFGSFMVTPFLGIYLKQTIRMDIHLVGTILAVATFIQFGGGVVGGVVAERFGLKATMVFSLAFRTVGFVMLALTTSSPQIIIPAVILVAAGPALYLPSNRAYVISSVSAEFKPLFLSISNAVLNGGMALGPVVAAVFIDNDPFRLFFGVALLFFIITLVHQLTLPSDSSNEAIRNHVSIGDLLSAFNRTKCPLIFNVITFYLYFFFQNFMGLYISSVASVKLFGWVMLLNFTLLFFVQPLMSKKIATLRYRTLLAYSFSVMALGMLMMALGNALSILLGTAIMTLGQLALFLRGDLEMVATLSDVPAVAFGIQRLAAGVGGLLSGIVGGAIFAYYESTPTLGMFWIVIATQCLIAAALSFNCARSNKMLPTTSAMGQL